jgi:hypothetical protein
MPASVLILRMENNNFNAQLKIDPVFGLLVDKFERILKAVELQWRHHHVVEEIRKSSELIVPKKAA